MRYKSEKTMREIVEAIEDYFFTHKETPSITEIARAIGRSRSTVHAYLQEMSKLGQIWNVSSLMPFYMRTFRIQNRKLERKTASMRR